MAEEAGIVVVPSLNLDGDSRSSGLCLQQVYQCEAKSEGARQHDRRLAFARSEDHSQLSWNA